MQQLIITLMAISGLLAPLMGRKLQRLALLLSQTELAGSAAAPYGQRRRSSVARMAARHARNSRARAAAWRYGNKDQSALLQL